MEYGLWVFSVGVVCDDVIGGVRWEIGGGVFGMGVG